LLPPEFRGVFCPVEADQFDVFGCGKPHDFVMVVSVATVVVGGPCALDYIVGLGSVVGMLERCHV
jgi:hypothetical protein